MKRNVQAALLVVGALFLAMIASSASVSAPADELGVLLEREPVPEVRSERLWSVRLNFNHPVFASDARTSIQVTADGKKEDFELEDPNTGAEATGALRRFRLLPKKVSRKPEFIAIVVAKGLADASGRRVLPSESRFSFDAVKEIRITSISTYYRSATNKGLSLQMNGEVSEGDLKKAVRITPDVPNLTIVRAGWRGFRIRGDFEPGAAYLFKLSETKVDQGRSALLEKEHRFTGPGTKSQITFNTQHSVVELKSRQLLPVSLGNVTKVRCTLRRIPPYLVPEFAAALTQEKDLAKWPGEVRKQAMAGLVKAGKLTPQFAGDFTEDAEAFFAPEAKEHVYGYSVPLSFRKKPEVGGIYWTRLTDPDGVFKGESSRLVQITDLSVSYKLASETLLFWVTSIHTGEPVEGVHLILFSQDRSNRYFVGKTDKNGVLFVKEGQKVPGVAAGKEAGGVSIMPLRVSTLAHVVAATPTDCCTVDLISNRLKSFAVKATEDPNQIPKFINGYVFTERGVYQPGETVFFKFVAREYKDNKIVSPAGVETDVEIVGPKNDVVFSKKLALGDFGTCNDSFEVKRFLPVGTYTIKARVQVEERKPEVDKKRPKPQVFTRTFQVQEYKIPRHYVALSMKTEERISTEYVTLKRKMDYVSVQIQGRYYTGGPIKHGKVRWKATLVQATHNVQGYDGFFFGNADEEERFLESGESLLDQAGNLTLAIPMDSRTLTGLYGVQVSATVLDVDGEPATEVSTYNPKPKFLVGISRHPSQVQTGLSPRLKLIVLDAQGKRVSKGQITAALMEKTGFYTLKRDETGRVNYLWERGWMKPISSKTPIVNGEAEFQIELGEHRSYMISFSYDDGKGGTYSSQTAFKVGWEQYEYWLESKREEVSPSSKEILLSLTKKEYHVGEEVRVDFSTRRPVKKCLVAFERGNILRYEVIDVNGRQGSYKFTTSADFQPNVYVSVIAAAGRGDFPLFSSQADVDIPSVFFGYADVRIRPDVKALRVEIDPGRAELKGRPGEKAGLAFKVADQKGKGIKAELAVCVVDEAVLALTRFKTPELSSLTDFDLPLSVFSGDLRLALISQDLYRIFSTKPLTGGDAGLGLVSPTMRERFDPVAYFNPALITDESGRASVEFKLPDTTTKYRVYVVACDKGAGFASEQRDMLVTKEFFIEPSVMRFLIPGDKITIPVVLNNKTNEQGDASLAAQASKGLIVKLAQAQIKMEPQAIVPVDTIINATSGTEKGTLEFQGKFTSKSGQFSDGVRKSFPVHSRYLPIERTMLGQSVKKAEISVELPKELKKLQPEEVHPEDLQARLSLTTTNWNKIAPGLKYLLVYPFGCVEQTSSGVIPLAHLRTLVKTGVIPEITVERVDNYLKSGVTRLVSMQVENGGFAYWPGDPNASWWASIYAAFALTSAHQAGIAVPADSLKSAGAFVRNNLFRERGHSTQRIDAWTRELALYILAVNKMLTPAELEPFFKNFDFLDNHQKALLLLAAKEIGYESVEKLQGKVEKLDPVVDPMKSNYDNSSFRTIALCLLAAAETKSPSPKKDTWAGYLLNNLHPEGRWHSTADTGWCLLALAKYFESKGDTSSKKIPCRVRYAGEPPIDVTVTDVPASLDLSLRKLLDNGKIVIESDEKDLINYTLYLTYPDMAFDPSELAKGLTLHKRIENLNGKKEIRVGDVVRVILETNVPGSYGRRDWRHLEYLALVDPLPAGLVAINSELKTEGAATEGSRVEDYWQDGFYEFRPNFFEIRHDRVRVFKNRAWPGSYKYSYLARAVSEGDFWMRSSRISLMYNPEVFGKTKGERIQILPAQK